MTVRDVTLLVQSWSGEEQEELRDWLDNLLEHELEMTDEFKAKIQAGFADIAVGKGRLHKP
jgi:hypothetical protein